MMRLENYPEGTRKSVIGRIPLKEYRTMSSNINNNQPVETFLNKWELERELSEGLREKGHKAFFLSSFAPMFLAAEATAGGDSGGGIALLLCVGLTIYLFSLTGWSNEEP